VLILALASGQEVVIGVPKDLPAGTICQAFSQTLLRAWAVWCQRCASFEGLSAYLSGTSPR